MTTRHDEQMLIFALRDQNDRLCKALDKCLQLVAKGAAEGAYNNMVAGPEYAERVFQSARAELKHVRATA